MFRSGERGRPAVAVVVLAAGLSLTPVTASGNEPTPSVTSAPGPSPGAEVIAAPVVDIEAPVRDIAFTSADPKGVARIEEKPTRIKVTLDATVLFGKDSATLRGAARSRLAEVAARLRRTRPGAVGIVGYTDDLGTAAHGLTLSRRRAGAVAAALRPLLPAASFPFTVAGKGEADPAVPNDSEANRKRNRRVELTYVPR